MITAGLSAAKGRQCARAYAAINKLSKIGIFNACSLSLVSPGGGEGKGRKPFSLQGVVER
jgi:hypothetical protein